MITFITFLRCIAAMLITNAHYTGIYPTDLIANGGLIGDIIFFCVSGYCLTNLKTGFFKWYTKRVGRVLPVVILISAVYILLGRYDFSVYASGTEQTLLYQGLSALGLTYPKFLSWFVYPTYYHFVASILVLYIPYYFVLKCNWTRERLPLVMLVTFAVFTLIYTFIYDKSYYHIDTVREPFIRILFFESMILGAYFKLVDKNMRNTGKPVLYFIGAGVSFAVYFASKILLTKKDSLAPFQFFNQLVIFALLFFVMRFFSSIDSVLEKAPKWLSKVVGLVAKLTLEIYLVQYVLIDLVREWDLPFPVNWVVLTLLIVAAAFVLNKVMSFLTIGTEKALAKIKKS